MSTLRTSLPAFVRVLPVAIGLLAMANSLRHLEAQEILFQEQANGRQELILTTPQPAEAARPNKGADGMPDDLTQPVKISIVSPAPGEVVPNGPTDLFLQVDNYTLTEGGNCLHVLLNNNTPLVLSDVRAPLTFRELPEGGHTVRVVAVGPDGRALRQQEAFASLHFFVGRKDFQNYVGPGKPQLIMNLPSGGIVDIAEGGKVWMDALTVNAALAESEGYKIRYSLNGSEGFLSKNEPIYWAGLKAGRYDFEAQLVNSDNVPEQGVFNHVKRSFEVRVNEKALPMEAEAEARVIAVAAAPVEGAASDPTQALAPEPGHDAAPAAAVVAAVDESTLPEATAPAPLPGENELPQPEPPLDAETDIAEAEPVDEEANEPSPPPVIRRGTTSGSKVRRRAPRSDDE